MSNKYWTDKTNGVDAILAENFNSAFAGIESDIAQKANKFVETEISNINEKLEQKADKTSVDAALEQKADKTIVDEINVTLEQNSEALSVLKQRSIPHTKVSGYPISVTDHLDAEQVIDYKIYGNSVQDGTPSADNPIEIQSVGDLVTDETSEYYGKYDVPIVVSGKNLLSYPFIYTTRTAGGVTWNDNCDGTVTVSGNVTNYSDFLFSYVKVAPNTQYCCSGIDETENVFMILRLFNKDDVEFKLLTADGKSSKTILFNSAEYPDATYMRLGVKSNSNNATISGTIKPMIEIGTTATEFESCIYKETHYIYLDEPLRKVGEYADYIDYKNQKVVRKVKSNTVNFKKYNYDSTSKWLYLSSSLPDMIPDNLNFLSNKIKTFRPFPGSADSNALMISYKSLYYFITAEEDEIQGYIDKMQNITLYYPLETIIEENISLPALKTFKGTSVMSINTSIQPSNVELTYYQDINKKIAELQAAITALGGI